MAVSEGCAIPERTNNQSRGETLGNDTGEHTSEIVPVCQEVGRFAHQILSATARGLLRGVIYMLVFLVY